MNVLQTNIENTMQTQKRTRRYDLDWLRVTAIAILLYYHVGMIYVSWDWHINSEPTSDFLEVIMVFLHQWRMPLLFMISGIGTYFALGFRSAKKYSWERTKRLICSCIVGYFCHCSSSDLSGEII